MSVFDQTPVFTTVELLPILQANYGLEGDLTSLPSERDQNFRLSCRDGRRYVVKIANAAEDLAALDFQNRVLNRLATVLELTPRLLSTLDGRQICEVPGSDGRGRHLLRVLSFLPGEPLARCPIHSPALLGDLGRTLAEVDRALAELGENPFHEDFPWHPDQAFAVIAEHAGKISELGLRRKIRVFAGEARERLQTVWSELPRSLIYNDANDYNVLVQRQRVSGLIDFGDLVYGSTVADPAVACAYAVLGKSDPLAAILPIVSAYHRVRPLAGNEIAALIDLLRLRLCVSVCLAAWQRRRRPQDEYLFISQQPIMAALPGLLSLNYGLTLARLRQACDADPLENARGVLDWLQRERDRNGFAPVVEADWSGHKLKVLDLSIASPLYQGDPQRNGEAELTARIQAETDGAQPGVGRYDEARLLYVSPLFQTGPTGTEARTVHLGVDLFMPPGTAVFAPLDGVVHAFARNRARLDYGPVIILKHRDPHGRTFYTLYGHLSPASLRGLHIGKVIPKGERFARLGTAEVNGGWTPHLHFQIILDLFGLGTDFPGVARPSEREFWCTVSPDPNLILGIPHDAFPAPDPDRSQTLAARKRYIGPSLSIGYQEPVKLVRGWMQYLYDENGRRYLDCYNNVPHVGHCHPKVVEAIRRQTGLLNTNTRYLHDHINAFAEKLTATLPEKLQVCYFLNSASEANELALRLARTVTGRRDMIVLEAAYHGHTSSLIDISPYKHDGPGGLGAPDWVHAAPLADVYRGRYKADDPRAGAKYAAAVAEILAGMRRNGRAPAGFIAESCPSVGGQIFFPAGYLAEVYRLVRAAGGVCIADEVQTGYGRIGNGFYAFETQGVEPDMVVLGKPIGNGHPLAALVTTREIADAFHNGMEFFSTFGGNPVSCLVGATVLDVVLEERLQAHALETGNHLLAGLRPLKEKHVVVGDVRGSGLFLGVELVRDRRTLEPADSEAAYVVNRLRQEGILLGSDGPFHNVIKIRPPMPFDTSDADFLVSVLDQVLGEL